MSLPEAIEAALNSLKVPELDTMDSAVLTGLLAEYQGAQDSAQHHDTIAWTVMSVLFGSSILLLASLLQRGSSDGAEVMALACAPLGIALAINALRLRKVLNELVRQKYARCKDIECVLGLKQHVALKYELRTAHRILRLAVISLVLIWALVAAQALVLLHAKTCCGTAQNEAVSERPSLRDQAALKYKARNAAEPGCSTGRPTH